MVRLVHNGAMNRDDEGDWGELREELRERLEPYRSPLELFTMAITIEVVCVGIVWLVWQWIAK